MDELNFGVKNQNVCISEGQKGGRAPPCEGVFEAEKFQCVDLFLVCELRGDVELL